MIERRAAARALVALALGLAACSSGGDADEGSAVDGPTPTAGAYLPDDGLIVIEMESAAATGDWAEEAALAGFTGTSYYRWDGPNQYSTPDVDTFGFDFWIEDPGRYHFRIHNRHDDPDSTLANDCWSRIDGGTWTKTFSWQRGQWTWATQHEFSHSNKPPAEFTLTRGNHRIEFSGRSFDFMMDRLHLYDDDVVNPESTAHPESARAPGSTTTAGMPGLASARRLTVSPFHVPALLPSGGLGMRPPEEELAALDAALALVEPARAAGRALDVVLVDTRSIEFGGVDLSRDLPARPALVERLVGAFAGDDVRWVVEAGRETPLAGLTELAALVRHADVGDRPFVVRVEQTATRRVEGIGDGSGFDLVESRSTVPPPEPEPE